MPTLVDWRAMICHSLDIPPEISDQDLGKAMEDASHQLKEISRLRAAARKQQGPPREQVIYSVECRNLGNKSKYYLDRPWVVDSGPYNAHLMASSPINNFDLYLERNKEIIFIVYRYYRCCHKPVIDAPETQGEVGLGIDASLLLQGEQIDLMAPELQAALGQIAEVALRGIPHPAFSKASAAQEDDRILYPYIWYFHRRAEIQEEFNKLPPAARRYVGRFRKYIENRMMEEWANVEELLESGRISAEYMEYLIVSKTPYLLIASGMPEWVAGWSVRSLGSLQMSRSQGKL